MTEMDGQHGSADDLPPDYGPVDIPAEEADAEDEWDADADAEAEEDDEADSLLADMADDVRAQDRDPDSILRGMFGR
jgi:hypothetical protein